MKNKFPIIDPKKTGQRLKFIIKQHGFTVKSIQEYLGLATPQSIYHWFEGRNMPSIDNLYALSELFNMPMDTMIVGNRKINFSTDEIYIQRMYSYCEKYMISIA